MKLTLIRSLAVPVALSFCQVVGATVFPSASMTATQTFTSALGSTTMMLTWDGAQYWEVTGGSTSGVREASYSAALATLNTYSPGLDFRSIFPDATGALYARTYNSLAIYKQTSPGVFSSYATLAGSFLASSGGDQVGVVLNGAGTEYVGQLSGTVGRWGLNGSYIGSVALNGYGSITGETSYPQAARMAAWGPYYLTFSNGILSAWDNAGNRVDQTTLVAAGSTFNSYYSISFANGYAWVIDNSSSTWRGYPIGAAATITTTVPTLSGWAIGLLAILLAGAALWAMPRLAREG